MGWKLNAVALLVMLWALFSGTWTIGIPLLAYFGYLVVKRVRHDQGGGQGSLPRVGTVRWLGIFLLLLSVIALASGGVFSPLVFGALGVAALLYGTKPGLLLRSASVPVEDSILLRDRWFPFRWCAVAELKLVTRDAAKVLAAVEGVLVIRLEGKAKAFLVFEESSFSLHGAEEKVAARMRELARTLTPIGAYVMPLKEKDAFGVTNGAGEKVSSQKGDLEHALATSPYDVLSLRTSGRTVKEIGAFRASGDVGTSILRGDPAPKPVTMWEVASILGKRAEWSEPDEVTAFLSSVAATKGATAGERFVSAGNPESQALAVRSVRTSPVELSRSQLRLLMEVYS